MRSVILMFRPAHGFFLVLTGLCFSMAGFSQVNSPYSRYGIGDLYNGRSVVSQGMGGLATPYTDIQSVNFINPASYASIGFVTFDVGIETEFRTLSNQARTNRFESSNLIFNYAAMGVPLKKNKKKDQTVWGMAFGLRPVSRIRYNIQTSDRVNGIDSTLTEYRGTGGLYRAFLGTGFRIGGLSLGVNGGFVFGQIEQGTFRSLVNDSVFYYTGAINQRTSISRFAMDAGMQYEIKTSKSSVVRLGANGYLGGDATAQRERVSQTVFFNNFGNPDSIDVVGRDNSSGTYTFPVGYTVGLAFEKTNKFLLGGEYETAKWSELTNFGQAQMMGDVALLRVGGHFIPDAFSARNYFKQVIYRAGMFTGKDYVVVNGHQLPVFGLSFGAGFPIRRYNQYSTQFNTINLAFEYGRRGNSNSLYTERYFKLSFGLSLSDVWFIKRQYD
jgi:hypothetical protein